MKVWTLVTLLIALLAAGLLATSAFAREPKSANGPELLLRLEAEFAADAAQHGHDAFLHYFAEDGVELDDGGGIVSKEEMRKQPPWGEGTSLSWNPVHADMAASGDLGYTYGTYVFKHKDKTGNIVTDYGKYTSIWKKQKDGTWKVVVDMGNTSPPPKRSE